MPFNCFAAGSASQRYQQVYLATQFPQAGLIDMISFRLKPERNAFGPSILPNVQIDMSITQAEPNNLSIIFDDNLGPSVSTVFSGDLTIEGTSCDPPGPCPFSVVIPLDEPFAYFPSNGNLIIDYRINTCAMLSDFELVFDATNIQTDITTRLIAIDNVNSPTGGPTEFGLVTQFNLSPLTVLSPIPTLSEWGLIAMAGILGIVGYLVIRRRKVSA